MRTSKACSTKPSFPDIRTGENHDHLHHLQHLSTFSRRGHWKNIEALKALAIKKGMVGTITIRYSVLDLSGKGRSSDDDEIKVTL